MFAIEEVLVVGSGCDLLKVFGYRNDEYFPRLILERVEVEPGRSGRDWRRWVSTSC